MRRRSLATVIATSLITGLTLLALTLPVRATDTVEVTLDRGDVTLSASAQGGLIAFGLAGRIWTMAPDGGIATQVSDEDELARRPALSADGLRVAYEVRRDGYDQIFVRRLDGGASRQVTFGEFHHRAPAWRPGAANSLLLSTDRGGTFGAWEVDVNTLELRKLTASGGEEREPSWDPTGERLAYVADTRFGSALFVVMPGGKPQKLVEERAIIRAPTWRPGGGVIIYTREQGSERQLRMLLMSQPTITKPISNGEDVAAQPVAWLDRMNYLYAAGGRLYRREFGERNPAPVPFSAGFVVARRDAPPAELADAVPGNRPVIGHNGASYAPDGSYIVAALGDLWEVGADGMLRRQLTNDPYVDAMPVTSPDGQRVVFVSDRGGSLQVWRLDLASGRLRRLTREAGIALEPRWIDGGLEYATGAHAAVPALTRKRIMLRSTEAAAATDADARPPGTIPLTWRPFTPNGRLIVQAGRIFDGLGTGYLERHEIVIEGDRITGVRPWTDATDEDTRVIDARERTVLPGLIDLSTRQPRLGDERLGRKYLGYGVTTVREAGSNPDEAAERSESWASGQRIGPRLMSVADSALAGDDPLANALNGTAEVRLPPQSRNFGELAAVAGMLEATITSNLAPIGLPLLVRRGELAGGWQYRELFTRAELDWYRSEWRQADIARQRQLLDAHTEALTEAVANGARLVTGSDAPTVPPGLGLHAELRLLTEAGLPPLEVLRMATVYAGPVVGADGRLGVIRPGALADIVIVDGDPLANIRDLLKIRATIARGRLYTQRELSLPGVRPRSVGNLYN